MGNETWNHFRYDINKRSKKQYDIWWDTIQFKNTLLSQREIKRLNYRVNEIQLNELNMSDMKLKKEGVWNLFMGNETSW